MDKAQRFADRVRDKAEKFAENHERDKELRRIFKEVREQRLSINKQKREIAKEYGQDGGPSADKEEERKPHDKDKKGRREGRKKKKKDRSKSSKKKRRGNPNNVRDKNKHLRMIELGDKIIMIDTHTAERENNKAEK